MRRGFALFLSLLPVAVVVGAIVVLVLAAGSTDPRPAVAQDPGAAPSGTPAPLSLPMVPHPRDCVVPPRDFADLAGLSATPMTLEELAPASPPAELAQAIPADEATSLAVLAVVRESIACSNAGDLTRGFALVTDGYLRRRVIAIAGPFDEAIYGTVATPMPLPADRHISLDAVGTVVILPDGRAAVDVEASDARTRRSLVLFVQTPDGWRIDELIPLEDSPPATTSDAEAAG